MKNIKEVSEIITVNNNDIEVSIPDTNFSTGLVFIKNILANNDSVESYLNKIISVNKASCLFIQRSSKNGTSRKQKGNHVIFLHKTEPVATVATNVAAPVATNVAEPVATVATNVAEPVATVELKQKTLNGLPETPLNKPKNTTMNDKDYIDFKVLEVKHQQLEGFYNEAKAKIAKLDKKVDDLQDENKQLLRENTTKEDKHAIALDRLKLDTEKESKEGLSGIVGEITNNPDLLKTLVGIFKPDHPMFKETPEQPALEGADNNREIKYTEDSEANAVLNDIPRSLSQRDGKTIAEVYLLFKEFIAKPELLEQAVKTFIPQYQS